MAIAACVLLAVGFLTDPVGDTIDNVVNQDGYVIASQTAKVIDISVPKAALPEDIYTSQGHTFDEGEVVVYQEGSTTIWLEKVMLSNESDEQLYFMFDMSYDISESGMVLLPYHVTSDLSDMSIYTLGMGMYTKDITDGEMVYPDAASLRGTGPNERFALYVDTDVCKTAQTELAFRLFGFWETEYTATEEVIAGYFAVESETINRSDSHEGYTLTVLEAIHYDNLVKIQAEVEFPEDILTENLAPLDLKVYFGEKKMNITSATSRVKSDETDRNLVEYEFAFGFALSNQGLNSNRLTISIRSFRYTDGTPGYVLEEPLTVSWEAQNIGKSLFYGAEIEKTQIGVEVSPLAISVIAYETEYEDLDSFIQALKIYDRYGNEMALKGGWSGGVSGSIIDLSMLFYEPLDVANIGKIMLGDIPIE